MEAEPIGGVLGGDGKCSSVPASQRDQVPAGEDDVPAQEALVGLGLPLLHEFLHVEAHLAP